MNIREIMHKDCKYLGHRDSVQLAATIMERENIGALPVAMDDKLVGMLTDRDIVRRAVAVNKNVRRTFVSDIMSKGVHYCYDDQDVDEVAQNMSESGVCRMPVVDRQKKLVGMVTFGDIAAKASPELAGASYARLVQADSRVAA